MCLSRVYGASLINLNQHLNASSLPSALEIMSMLETNNSMPSGVCGHYQE